MSARKPGKERNIQREVMLELSGRGYTIWRNNTGMAWRGSRHVRTEDGLLLLDPRPVEFGLCKGSSDLIGLRPRAITLEDVGNTIAQFVAIEVKAKRGRITKEQQRFLDHVEHAGGVALVVRSADALDELRR